MLQRYFCSVNYFALHNTVLYRKILLVFRSITVYSNHTSFHFAYEAWAFVWIKYQIKNHIPPVFHAVCNTAWYWTWYWTYRESSLLLNIKQTQVWVLVGSNRTWWPISMQVSVIIHYGTDLSHRCLLERRLTYFRLDPQEEKPRVDFEYKNSFQGNAYMCKCRLQHYSNVIMSVMVSQITGVSMVCSTICSGANQRKDQSPASLAFVRGIHRWPVNSLHKGPVTRKMFPFDDVIMKMSDILLRVSDVILNRRRFTIIGIPIINPRGLTTDLGRFLMEISVPVRYGVACGIHLWPPGEHFLRKLTRAWRNHTCQITLDNSGRLPGIPRVTWQVYETDILIVIWNSVEPTEVTKKIHLKMSPPRRAIL